jgi:sigma-B regulation protein RsbU (phosphoserine phosphatase)
VQERRWWEVADNERLAVAAALGVAALLTVLDALTPDTSFTSLFLLVPVVASAAATPRTTAILGGLSVVVGLSFVRSQDLGTGQTMVRIVGVLAGSAVAVGLARTRMRREQRLDDLDRFATIAQALIIRPVPARLADVGAAGRYISASKVVAVGGDLYDVALTPGGVRFIIGDACGKGLGGVRLAAAVLTAFRETVFIEPDVAALARQLDAHVIDVCRREGRELDFVTAVIGELQSDGELRVVSCGHPDGLLVAAGSATAITPADRAYPLGLGSEPVVDRHRLPIGARAFWWTDGASEARDDRGAFLDVESVVAGAAAGKRSLTATLDAVVDAVLHHAQGGIHDDVALLAIERMVPAPAGSWPGALSMEP